MQLTYIKLVNFGGGEDSDAGDVEIFGPSDCPFY